jgi:hypothetical protein
LSGTYGSCFGVSGVGVTGGEGGWLVMLFGSAIASAPLEFGIGKVIQGRLAGWTWDFKPSRAFSRRLRRGSDSLPGSIHILGIYSLMVA